MSSSAVNGTPSSRPRPRAPVDDRCGADDLRAGGSGHLHRLARRAAGRHDVLDDENPIGVRQREAAPEHQRAFLALREDCADAERAADFLSDDDAAERGRQHDGRAEVARPLGEGAAERLRVGRMLQHERALQVAGAVKPGRQAEVAFEQRARAAEQIEQLVSCHSIAT